MPAATSAPSPELFFATVTAYQRTAALKAAIDLDVFTVIGDGARTVAAIAGKCGVAPRGIRILCDYLTIAGLIRKDGVEYALTADSAVFLSRHSPAFVGGMLEFLASDAIVRNFDNLAATIRNGTVPETGNTVAEANPVWVKFARAMVPMAVPAAQTIATLLNVEAAGPLKVLDIAAGHGIYGITIAQRNQAAEIVAVDWEPVLAVATEHARAAGVERRHRTIAGDAFKVDYGTGYDLALVTNFLHHFDAAACTKFLTKVAAALNPAGRIAVLEFVPNADRVSPPFAAEFALSMLAGTPRGDAYTFEEIRQMLAGAGFKDAVLHPTQGPNMVIVASK
jgi:2-polyprenyl-3-methyl-5-hydroxy-6-metoxy-1,4-benzoquinol methylase